MFTFLLAALIYYLIGDLAGLLIVGACIASLGGCALWWMRAHGGRADQDKARPKLGISSPVVWLTLALLVAALLATGGAVTQDWGAILVGLGTELGGAAAIYVLIDRLILRPEKQREEFKELVRQMGSADRGEAVGAASEMRRRGYLWDGSLAGVDLCKADLSGAFLLGAKLKDGILYGTNLKGAVLSDADLSGAFLGDADLTEALLDGANLSGAFMMAVDLDKAVLSKANLADANLLIAYLDNAHFDCNTILPDGSRWTPEVDMARFTGVDFRQMLLDRKRMQQGE